jgi:hypothetical protein
MTLDKGPFQNILSINKLLNWFKIKRFKVVTSSNVMQLPDNMATSQVISSTILVDEKIQAR